MTVSPLIPGSESDIKEVKSLWEKVTAPPPVVVVPEGPAGAARKRKRTPAAAKSAAHSASPVQSKPKVKRTTIGTPKKSAKPKVNSQSRGSSTSNSSSSSSSSESDSVKPAKSKLNSKIVGTGLGKSPKTEPTSNPRRQLALRPVRPALAVASPAVVPHGQLPYSNSPSITPLDSLRIQQLELELAGYRRAASVAALYGQQNVNVPPVHGIHFGETKGIPSPVSTSSSSSMIPRMNVQATPYGHGTPMNMSGNIV